MQMSVVAFYAVQKFQKLATAIEMEVALLEFRNWLFVQIILEMLIMLKYGEKVAYQVFDYLRRKTFDFIVMVCNHVTVIFICTWL